MTGARATERKAYLEALLGSLDRARDLLVAGLGANARYLPHLSVPVPHVALCDAMGCAIPLALGMALGLPDRHVVALEGDGSLLMNLGTLGTVGAARPPNLTTLVFRNRRYESSGGQTLPPGRHRLRRGRARGRLRARPGHPRHVGLGAGVRPGPWGGRPGAARPRNGLRSARADSPVLRAS